LPKKPPQQESMQAFTVGKISGAERVGVELVEAYFAYGFRVVIILLNLGKPFVSTLKNESSESNRKNTMSKSEGKSKIGVCVYCGLEKETTQEHVIPKALYPEPYPSNMITVRTCLDCNNPKSTDDVYLRDFLLSDMATQASPTAQEIWKGKFIRSVERNSSEIARLVVKNPLPTAVFLPNGDYIGHAIAVSVDRTRLDRIFSLMVRGLWFYFYKEMMPHDCKFDVYAMDRFLIVEAWEEMRQAGANMAEARIDVFVCQCLNDPEPFLSRWLLLFYNTVIMEVYTIPKGSTYSPRRKLPSPPLTRLEPDPDFEFERDSDSDSKFEFDY
jgi:hypothetical protein